MFTKHKEKEEPTLKDKCITRDCTDCPHRYICWTECFARTKSKNFCSDERHEWYTIHKFDDWRMQDMPERGLSEIHWKNGELLICGKCGALKTDFTRVHTETTKASHLWADAESYRWIMNHILPASVKEKILCTDTK